MLIIFLIPLNTNDVFSDNFYTLNNEVDTDTAAQEENDSQGEIIVVTVEKYWHILQLPELRKVSLIRLCPGEVAGIKFTKKYSSVLCFDFGIVLVYLFSS